MLVLPKNVNKTVEYLCGHSLQWDVTWMSSCFNYLLQLNNFKIGSFTVFYE